MRKLFCVRVIYACIGKPLGNIAGRLSNALLLLPFTPASAQTLPSTPEASGYFPWLICAIVLVGGVISIVAVRSALAKTTWSLADALSEDVAITLLDTTNPASPVPIKDADGKQQQVTVMRASSSRLIALMGLIVLLALFFGFGLYILFTLASGGKIEQSVYGDLRGFLLGGMSLFAPYIVNKFTSVFKMPGQ